MVGRSVSYRWLRVEVLAVIKLKFVLKGISEFHLTIGATLLVFLGTKLHTSSE